MSIRTFTVALVAFGMLILITEDASAQRPSYTPPSPNANANALRSPTVSPYLNLLRGGPGSYQSLVQPLVNNNQASRQNARQIQQLERNNAARRTGRSSGSQLFAPTGHTTAFRNYSHFYPNMSR